MKIKHNKKRNTGLLYEFFSRYISRCVVLNDSKNMKKAMLVLKRYFKEGTMINKELKIFNAINEISFSHRESAFRVLDDIRELAGTISKKKIEREKSFLISEINRKLNDKNNSFYNCRVKNYIDFANVQNLIDSYRDNKRDNNVRLFEDRIVSLLLERKKQKFLNLNELKTDMNSLAVKIAVNKFNNKYHELNKPQKMIIEEFVRNGCESDNFISKMANVTNKVIDKLMEDDEIKENNLVYERLSEAKIKLDRTIGDQDKTNNEKAAMLLHYLELTNEIK